LPGEQPFNPPVGSFGWPTLDSRMFIPPWYQPLIVQPILEPATKLPYTKLQYPTYVKDTNPNAHIRVFKKAIKTNGEIMEIDIINWVLLSGIVSLNGVKTTFKTIQTTLLKSWNKHFASNSKL
jgi:hypothetical protein